VKPGIVFYKMTGSGNDFIALDGRYVAVEQVSPALVSGLCDRRRGAGADGVMLLDPRTGDDVHFTFHFWNSDGSPGPMCGNGALCATSLATILGFAPADGEVRFATKAGVHSGWLMKENQSEIALPDCGFPLARPAVAVHPGERTPMLGSPSVPHLVLEVDDVDAVDVASRGPSLRHDPALGPGGANVNWVAAVGDSSWRMRTYERGVEAETLACGTGSVACALSLGVLGKAVSPVRIWTRGGLPLDVSWDATGERAASIRLRGEGRMVFRGILVSLPTPR
jgi:diaminopimelate epimerase